MTSTERDALHVFFGDDSEEWWVATSLDDLRAQQFDTVGEDDWHPEDWNQVDDAKPKAILFVPWKGAEPTPADMATDEDWPENCREVTKTWGEWAAWHGRGYFGGGRS